MIWQKLSHLVYLLLLKGGIHQQDKLVLVLLGCSNLMVFFFFHRHLFWGWYLTRGCHGYSVVGTTLDWVENLKCRNPIGKCILLMSPCVGLLSLNYLSLLFLLFGKWQLILIDDMTACPWIILYGWLCMAVLFDLCDCMDE